MNDEFDDYFSGKKIYGNDFSYEEIEQWYLDESEAYSGLVDSEKKEYHYQYNELNRQHGFHYLDGKSNLSALGIGSALGDEFLPILGKIASLKIIEPSERLSNNSVIKSIPCDYIKPSVSGKIPFEDDSFSLITCFGALHHIPNVTYSLSEYYRCLKPGGIALIREPISSMGDWRVQRVGLTKRERGIPLKQMDDNLKEIGFAIVSRKLCVFPVVARVSKMLGKSPYNSKLITSLDSLLCRAFSNDIKYHRVSFLDKLSPGCVYYVVTKN